MLKWPKWPLLPPSGLRRGWGARSMVQACHFRSVIPSKPGCVLTSTLTENAQPLLSPLCLYLSSIYYPFWFCSKVILDYLGRDDDHERQSECLPSIDKPADQVAHKFRWSPPMAFIQKLNKPIRNKVQHVAFILMENDVKGKAGEFRGRNLWSELEKICSAQKSRYRLYWEDINRSHRKFFKEIL